MGQTDDKDRNSEGAPCISDDIGIDGGKGEKKKTEDGHDTMGYGISDFFTE